MKEVYPVGTYSYLATLVLVFLLTDFVRYKPAIILCGLSGTITYIVIILGNSIAWMQFLEFTYGLFMSTEVAYYTYIYAKVSKDRYQVVSSYTRGAFLFGRFASGTVAQLTTSFHILDYHQLNYLTLAGTTLATCWALFLPPVQKSVYFHRPETENLNEDSKLKNLPEFFSFDAVCKRSKFSKNIKRAYAYLWRDFVSAFTNCHVVKWSLWWAFATCGYLQVISYIQPLWQTAVDADTEIYNGAVEAVYTIIGALAVFMVGKLRLNWSTVGEILLSIFSLLEALLLFVSSMNYNIWILYAVYIVFGVIYHTMITVASFEVAKSLSDDSYGLVFGINTLLALALQSLLTFIVVGDTFFDLGVRTQFKIYSGYFVILGAVFMVMGVYTIGKLSRTGKKFRLCLQKEASIEVVEDPSYDRPS
ncbi:thiamine transporter 1 isoform X2 [Venturia canescens]|nr:thiamine transporter 1 isoform X2 [Venturia canescens]